jgi:hypothetical protein
MRQAVQDLIYCTYTLRLYLGRMKNALKSIKFLILIRVQVVDNGVGLIRHQGIRNLVD